MRKICAYSFLLLLLLSACVKQEEPTAAPQEIPSETVVDMTMNANRGDSLEALKKEIASLDERQEYALAFEILNNYLVSNYSVDAISYALDHATSHYDRLHAKNKIFHNASIIYGSKLSSQLYSLFGIYVSDNITKSEFDELEKIMKSDWSDNSMALKMIKEYEMLKKNVKFYIKLQERNYPLYASEDLKSKFFILRNKTLDLQRKIIADRCNYVSYHVISPRLTKARFEIYSSFKRSFWGGRSWNKDVARNTLISLSHSFHSSWLNTSHEDVRLQFLGLIKEAKFQFGEAEWRELETITTLTDSADPSKKRGANVWWDEP